MKRLFLATFLVCLVLTCTAQRKAAQRKAIDQAETFIKSGKNLDKAEKLMTDLLRDSTNRLNHKVWLTLIDAIKLQYDQGNQKLYLKQQYDTAALFKNAKKLLLCCEQFDSLETTPDKKGKVRVKYRARHAAMLNAMRPNIYNGGAFYLRKLDFNNSWAFYDAYLDCAQQPLFTDYSYDRTDTLQVKAAYRALYCGYRLNDLEKTMKYFDIACRDTAHGENIMQYVAERQLQHGDTAAYVESLKRGFQIAPRNTFFFPRLVDYYNMRQQTDSASIFIDNALRDDSTNYLAVFAKSTALLNAQQYDSCLVITRKLLQINDSMPEAYCNMGLAYYNQALQLEASQQHLKRRTKKQRQAVNELFEKSRPYMEIFRQKAPEQQDKWLPALYTIYLNLNMGKEFEEIDKTIGK
ncbi:MAG: hypothetical protein J5529_06530 [Prevotella sp.]|nr:hypothetical protein [Prevotella sp.]